MDATVLGALIGGGLSAVGALGTQWIAAWRANEQEANTLARDEAQANRTRIDYLREVLEAASLALQEAGLRFDNTGNTVAWADQGRMKVTQNDIGEELSPKDALMDPLREFQESLGDVWRQESRLSLLIPEDHDALAGFHAAAVAYYRGLTAFDRWHDGALTGQELWDALRQTQADVRAAEKQFHDGSRSAIGPKLARGQ